MSQPRRRRRPFVSDANEAVERAERENRSRMKELVEIARRYWLDGDTQSKIAEDRKLNASTVTRILQEARALGVVDIRIDERFAAQADVDRGLGRQVRDRFGLDDCSAVAVRTLNPYDHREDEYLHQALARIAGQGFESALDAGDYVAVSGGRAAYQTVQVAVKNRPHKKNIHITPLCGRVWAHSWELAGPNITRPLDADDVAVALASGLTEEPGTSFSQVIYPLFVGNRADAISTMDLHCSFLSTGDWSRKKVPSRAIVGIGAVHPKGGHRFWDIIRGDVRTGEITPYLRSAGDQLREAHTFAMEKGLPHFGDVGNRLFPALPLPKSLEQYDLDSLWPCIEDLHIKLNEINGRMVIANWKHLRAVPRVMAVAGGPLKLDVVWTLLLAGYLQPQDRVITQLCTDTGTAQKLLEGLEAFEREGRRIREAYEEVTGRLFA